MTSHLPSRSQRESETPIRSVKEFVRRYFPSAKECPHCNGTGMIRASKYDPFRVDSAGTTKAPRRRANDPGHGNQEGGS